MPETNETNERRETGSPVALFLGDTPGRVFVRLLILSLLVGFLMAMFGVSPRDIFASLRGLVSGIFQNGAEVLRDAVGYAVAGAMVVVPVWLVIRLLSAGRKH